MKRQLYTLLSALCLLILAAERSSWYLAATLLATTGPEEYYYPSSSAARPSIPTSLSADSAGTPATTIDRSDSIHTNAVCKAMLEYIMMQPVTNDEPAPPPLERLDDNATIAVEVASLPSIRSIWKHLQPRLVDEMHSFVVSTLEAYSLQDEMRLDIQSWMKDFTPAKLRRALVHPLSDQDTHRLLSLLHEKLSDNTSNSPIEIMVFGGSVVDGTNAWINPWIPENKIIRRIMRQSRSFSYPSRLGSILNHLFGRKEVVNVRNMAAGGISSDSGAMVLEYGLFELPYPDIIIHDYSVNDLGFSGTEEARLEIKQQFVQAAKQLRCDCEPIVILVDSLFGVVKTDLMEASQSFKSVAQLSTWYNVMGISYPKAVKHDVWSGMMMDNSNNSSTNSSKQRLPYLMESVQMHPGLVFHSTLPWVLLFGLLYNMEQSCLDYDDTMPPSKKMNPSFMPSLATGDQLHDLHGRWQERIHAHQGYCRQSTHHHSLCSDKSWVLNRIAGLSYADQIETHMRTKLNVTNNRDWNVEGKGPVQKPRPGWVAVARNATFEISFIIDRTAVIKTLTVVYMKSYGDKWQNSRLQMTVNDEILSKELVGYHDMNTSIVKPHKFQLNEPLEAGTNLTVRFDLIGGSAFRIQGILFCSR